MEDYYWQIPTLVTLVALSSVSKAIQDKLQFHYSSSIFPKLTKAENFWNPQFSWRNKYKNNDPKQGEKFYGSTTMFVSLTDGWHLFGLLRNLSIISCIAVASKNPYYLLIYPLYIGIFHITFTYLLKQRK